MFRHIQDFRSTLVAMTTKFTKLQSSKYHLFISPLTSTFTAFRALAELNTNSIQFFRSVKVFLNIQVVVKPPF